MKKSNKQLTDIVYNIYRELYNNSEPKADFDELVKNAPLTEDGKKKIDYMAYEIDDNLMKNIIDNHCTINKLTKSEKSAIHMSIYLGCSPKSKKTIKDE